MSMDFDDLQEAECEVETEPNPTTCRPDLADGGDGNGGGDDDDDPVIPPSDDDRCADPGFYDSNPDICAGYPRLILKPSYAITESGKTVQYKTYLRTGGDEQELTLGLTYTSADVEVAVIQAQTGLATGVQPGIGNIAVAWQNLNAFAQIEVVEDCADITANFLLVFDQSFSSSAGFSGSYASRLAFAKAAGIEFAESVNWSKDRVGVMRFDTTGTIVQDLTNDQELVTAAISSIAIGVNGTILAGAFHYAVNHMTIAANNNADRRIIVLFSDGETNGPYHVDYQTIARVFKEQGGIVVIVALRAWGTYFNELYKAASPGFFLSAYGATQSQVIETLAGIKSYLCAGDCQPEPGTFPTAQLNYTGFTNWDVIAGAVDLIGLGVWDVQPGNGLYVDLSGTKTAGVPSPNDGAIRSKDTFDFEAGKTYRFSINVAGNNVNQTTDIEPVVISIKDASNNVVYTRTITPTSHNMPFTTYTQDFTPGGSLTGCKIHISKTPVIANNVGPLIDVIVLENVTDALTMFSDDFDEENPTTIPPGYGYYGCLTAPPGAQTADPTPPPVLEI